MSTAPSALASTFRQRCTFIIEMARRLHACGTSTPRLEGAVLVLSRRLGVLARRTLADVSAFRLAADVALVRALGGGFREQEGQ